MTYFADDGLVAGAVAQNNVLSVRGDLPVRLLAPHLFKTQTIVDNVKFVCSQGYKCLSTQMIPVHSNKQVHDINAMHNPYLSSELVLAVAVVLRDLSPAQRLLCLHLQHLTWRKTLVDSN